MLLAGAAATVGPVHPDEAPVVLLDHRHRPIGSVPKSQVHGADTPLHLAFSCYVFDGAGRLLLTRRAPGKRSFPGVWTNTCCGHPLPGEDSADAARRRLGEELGLRLERAAVVLPDFAYRAVAADGLVENEVCPVLVGTTSGTVDADPAEVAEHRWEDWASVVDLVRAAPWAVSPWAALQVPQLHELGPAPWRALDRAA